MRQSYLSQWVSPFHQPYEALVATYQRSLAAMGHAAGAHALAVGEVYRQFQIQVAILAYSDVFFLLAIFAFAVVPLCFLLTAKTGGGAPGAAH